MRRPLGMIAAVALLAACGSGGGGSLIDSRTTLTTAAAITTVPSTSVAPTTAKPTTTAAPTTAAPTTVRPTTTLAPTTTTGACELNPPLLADRLLEVEGYRYADYEADFMRGALSLVNDDPAALAAFEGMTRHLVTTEGQHLLGAFELLALCDATMTAQDVSDIVLHLYTTGRVTTTGETVGDLDIVYSAALSGAYDLWAWVDDGVAYTFWWTGFDGNEAYGTDFTRAFVATMQGLPVPEPTATGPDPGPGLQTEDEFLSARLLPVDGYLYLDPDFAEMTEFYSAFPTGGPIERATMHTIASEEQIACGGEFQNLGRLTLWEPKDAYKGNQDLIDDMITLFTSPEDSVSTTREMDIAGQTVTFAAIISPDGTLQDVFAWEYEGVVYVFYSAEGCPEEDDCLALMATFMTGLVFATVS